MAWNTPKLVVTRDQGGFKVDVFLSLLEPSEQRKIRKQMDISIFQWKELKGRVGAARATALKRAGMDVRRATQRQMSVRKETWRPKFFDGGTKNGERLIIKRYRVPKPDRVTSWKTERWPKGFLRSDIISDYDMQTQSVVVGPRMIPKLNRLHEVGGTVSLWFMPGVTPRFAPKKFRGAVFGTLSNFNRGRTQVNDQGKLEKQTENLQGAFFWGRRRVKPRRYMKKGLDAAMDRIPAAFRGFISGPTVTPSRQLRLF